MTWGNIFYNRISQLRTISFFTCRKHTLHRGKIIKHLGMANGLNYSISCLSIVIIRVRIVLRKNVVGDWRFDYLSVSHLQSRHKMIIFMPLVVVWIGQVAVLVFFFFFGLFFDMSIVCLFVCLFVRLLACI